LQLNSELHQHYSRDGLGQLAYKISAYNESSNRLSFDVGSMCPFYEVLKFGYSFKPHYYSIARCTLMLLRVTWALFRLLVICLFWFSPPCHAHS